MLTAEFVSHLVQHLALDTEF